MPAPPVFHETRFPEVISWGATGGPGYDTTVVEFDTGKEQRNQNWARARMAWDVSHGVKSQADLDKLIAFFRGRRGRAHGFRYKDLVDFKLEDETLQNSVDDTFVGDNSTVLFNVVKRYEIVPELPATSAINIEVRRIFKLRGGASDPLTELTLTVKLDGSTVDPADYTIDFDAGTVTFDTAPGTNVVPSIIVEFDVPARFEVDKMAISIEDFNAMTWGGIVVKELNPLLEPS